MTRPTETLMYTCGSVQVYVNIYDIKDQRVALFYDVEAKETFPAAPNVLYRNLTYWYAISKALEKINVRLMPAPPANRTSAPLPK